MESFNHNFSELFTQLGLPSDAAAVEQFIHDHRGLPGETRLWEADFWTPAQADFIRQSLEEDSDWSELVDQLDARLRG